MNAWKQYGNRMGLRGDNRRQIHLNREIQSIYSRLPENPSYTEAVLFDGMHSYNIESKKMQQYAQQRNVAIINSDNLNEKFIIGMPGEDIENGTLVCWMGEHWLVTERDANTTIYTKCKMLQCNYLLKWIGEDEQVYEQWCAIEDGTNVPSVRVIWRITIGQNR